MITTQSPVIKQTINVSATGFGNNVAIVVNNYTVNENGTFDCSEICHFTLQPLISSN